MKVKIIVHCVVENEGRFVWYALNSVLPFVDKIMVWDMSSTDGTWGIVRLIKSEKIESKQVDAAISAADLTVVRQQMLAATPAGYTWLMILDGDEIWSKKAIISVTEYARAHPEKESIVVRTHNLVGDIYHRLSDSAGRYHLAGHSGHLNLRLLNLKNIPGLKVDKPHGQQGYFDKTGRLVQDREPSKIVLLNVTYHHATHLARSSSRADDLKVIKRASKFKYALGETIPESEIPEVFFKPHPKLVPDVTKPASLSFWFKAILLTPLKHLKRLVIKSPSGY